MLLIYTARLEGDFTVNEMEHCMVRLDTNTTERDVWLRVTALLSDICIL